MGYAVPPAVQTVGAKDAILYALSVGHTDLEAIYEAALRPVPTLANIIAHPGPWMKALGVDWSRVVHAEHRLVLHRAIPIGVPLESRTRMLAVADRGADKGMFASFERIIHDQASGEPVATIIQVNGCRGDGGCGSAGTPPEPLPRPPAEDPDAVLDVAIPPMAAALYRLNGDLNPLHIDPAVAARGGFPRPILHGLCTFGHASRAIGQMAASPDAIAARFSAPFFPGETLRTEIWHRDGQVRFRARALERDTVVLDCGVASMKGR